MKKTKQPLRIVLSGASGKMGLVLQTLIRQSPQSYQLVALLGRYEKTATSSTPATHKELKTIQGTIDVVIDFSRPEFSMNTLAQAAEKNLAFISGTTGFSEKQLAIIDHYTTQCAVLMAANMSVGINLAVELVKITSMVSGPAARVEIWETHHQQKIDAPSGTALQLGETIAAIRSQPFKEVMEYKENSILARDQQHKIDFRVKREGEVIGDHSVTFNLEHESLTIAHHVTDRAVFARGALQAAGWIYGRDPGRYHMSDVLELKQKLALLLQGTSIN